MLPAMVITDEPPKRGDEEPEQSTQPEPPPAAGLGRPEPPEAVLFLTR